MQEKISVILPMYNAQNYISKCLESIMRQTYKNIEIIIVNDGSKDNSLEIANRYKNVDERIVVINKKNEGVSVARNMGIDNATSKWITFIDIDDYLEEDAIQNLATGISNGVDIILSKVYEIENNRKVSYKWKYDRNITFEENENKELIRTIFYENKNGEMNYIPNPFAKLYKLEMLKQNNIKFPKDIAVRRRCHL